MSRITISLCALLMVVGFSVAASAQDAEAPRDQTYDFDGDTVEGALLRPEGDLMGSTRHGKDSSLINIRADFIPEMIRSVQAF